MDRFRVEYKAFKSGEWYVVGEFIWRVAMAVAKVHTAGRSSRVIDVETGKTVFRSTGDPSLYNKFGNKP